MQAFQQGNQQGQQTLFNSLPQIQNALLGGSLDFSQFAPQQQQMPDTSFFQQQLPQFGQAPQQQPQQQTLQRPNNLAALLAGGVNLGGFGNSGFGGGGYLDKDIGINRRFY